MQELPIDFETFVDSCNKRSGDRKSIEGLKKMYDLFINDNEDTTISINQL